MGTLDGDFAEVCAEVLEDLGAIDAIKAQFPETEDGKLTDQQVNQRIDAYSRAFQRLARQLLSTEAPAEQDRQKAA